MSRLAMLTVPFFLSLLAIIQLGRYQQDLNDQQKVQDQPNLKMQEKLPVIGEQVDFTLIDTSAEQFRFQDLAGNVRVVSFFFTSCPATCPALNKELKKVAQSFQERADVHLISVTVDPERDTPEVLKNYVSKLEVNEDKWHFLTGEDEAIRSILQQQFLLGSSGLPDIHSAAAVLVDQQGRIRGYYRLLEEGGTSDLTRDLKLILNESS